MIQTKCLNGHYFDCEESEYCPLCGALSVERNKNLDNERKKSKLNIPFINRGASSSVQAKQMPTDSVSNTWGIWGSGRRGNDDVPTQTMTGGQFSDYNSSEMNFEIADDIYQETEPVIIPDVGIPYSDTQEEIVNSEAQQPHVRPNPVIPDAQSGLGQQFASAQAKTVGFFEMAGSANRAVQQPANVMPSVSNMTGTNTVASTSSEPVVGWLVCIKGAHLGECFNIYSGKSSMGRSNTNRIVFSKDGQISRDKHAFIMYEPKKREFFIQSGDSSGLTYLNEENIIGSRKIEAFDILELGGSQFVFVPLCSEKFAWEDYIGK